MRRIEPTTRFRRDYRREKKGRFASTLDADLAAVYAILARDRLLAPRYRDHALIGEWGDHRDCHLHPDLVLIYRKPDANTLQLVRLGSHAELDL